MERHGLREKKGEGEPGSQGSGLNGTKMEVAKLGRVCGSGALWAQSAAGEQGCVGAPSQAHPRGLFHENGLAHSMSTQIMNFCGREKKGVLSYRASLRGAPFVHQTCHNHLRHKYTRHTHPTTRARDQTRPKPVSDGARPRRAIAGGRSAPAQIAAT